MYLAQIRRSNEMDMKIYMHSHYSLPSVPLLYIFSTLIHSPQKFDSENKKYVFIFDLGTGTAFLLGPLLVQQPGTASGNHTENNTLHRYNMNVSSICNSTHEKEVIR